ncbi:MAG: EF-hand domain-containing protein [Polyangiaceae bacterium]
MLSDYQKAKFDHLFKIMDANKDGKLDPADLNTVVKRVADTRAPGADLARLKALSERYTFMQRGMLAMADTDKSGDVTLTEWMAYTDKVVTDPALYRELVGSLASLFHELIDHDGDDRNDLADYRVFLGVLQADARNASEVFTAMDKDGDGHISLADLNVALDDFYHGKEAGPGAHFFGAF